MKFETRVIHSGAAPDPFSGDVAPPNSPAPPELVRLSIGLEHPDDLIADLQQALAGN